ncbi:MAG: MarR family transcriptional regulator [Leptospiraceae bacterium]|nr:MarR family transcriptional regulator [Leptospiraceae bacterium]MCP5510360.1 MarR family transcriptional regulator [Leptospiraceae bacterium]
MKRSELLNTISAQIREFYRGLKKDSNKIMESEGITNGEFLVLRHVHSGIDGATLLAREMGVSASYITSISDKMIKKGYIERIRPETDRRTVKIQLTKTGKNLYLLLDIKIQKHLNNKFDSLTNQELKSFNEILLRIFQNKSNF